MKYISIIFTTFMLLLVTGCADNYLVPEQNINNEYTIVVSARMPSDNTTRVSLEETVGSLTLSAKWSVNDIIKTFFVQEGNVFEGEEATLYDISYDGKRCSFNITVPQSVNVYAPFDLYGFCGIPGLGVSINEGKILADVTPIECREISQLSAPVWFNASVREISKEISADFSHLGSYEVIHVQNNSSEEIDVSKCRLVPFRDNAEEWYYLRSAGYRPFYNPVTRVVKELQAAYTASDNPTLKIAAGESKAIVSWYVSKAVNIPELQLQLGNNMSVNTKPAKDFGMRAGRAYYVFGVWDGNKLTMTDDDFVVPVELPTITMTTSKAIGESITLAVDAAMEDRPNVWIDLNNNGLKDEGEEITSFLAGVGGTLGSQTVTIYGKVTSLYCEGQRLTALNVTRNTELTSLDCNGNDLTALDVSNNTELTKLYCNSNKLNSLDLSNNIELTELNCWSNRLTTLDVSKNTKLTLLLCPENRLTELDVSQNTKLVKLLCSGNQLVGLDVSANIELDELWCARNQISSDNMAVLVNSLSDRTGNNAGSFRVVAPGFPEEGNVITAAQGAIATDKNWTLLDGRGNPYTPPGGTSGGSGSRPDMPGQKW